MPDDNCPECKIILDGALACEAVAMVHAAPAGSLMVQECTALDRFIYQQTAAAGSLVKFLRPNSTALAELMKMSQDQCDFAEQIMGWRDANQFDDVTALLIRKRRLAYHYFQRDLAKGESAVWSPDYDG